MYFLTGFNFLSENYEIHTCDLLNIKYTLAKVSKIYSNQNYGLSQNLDLLPHNLNVVAFIIILSYYLILLM